MWPLMVVASLLGTTAQVGERVSTVDGETVDGVTVDDVEIAEPAPDGIQEPSTMTSESGATQARDVTLAPATATDTQPSSLDVGIERLDALDIDGATSALESAARGGPYSLEDATRLFAALGVTRAYLDDEAGAASAFSHLLDVAPGFDLPYTTSPKATFVFERVRKTKSTARRLDVNVTVPLVQRFDTPIVISLHRTGDTRAALTSVTLFSRTKGDAQWNAQSVILNDDEPVAITLPPVSSTTASEDIDGTKGTILEIAVSAFDARGWEMVRAPSKTVPLEIPVGFDAPGPWYTSPLTLSVGAAAAAAVAVVVTSAVIGGAVLVTYRSPTVPVVIEKRVVP